MQLPCPSPSFVLLDGIKGGLAGACSSCANSARSSDTHERLEWCNLELLELVWLRLWGYGGIMVGEGASSCPLLRWGLRLRLWEVLWWASGERARGQRASSCPLLRPPFCFCALWALPTPQFARLRLPVSCGTLPHLLRPPPFRLPRTPPHFALSAPDARADGTGAQSHAPGQPGGVL